MKKFYYLLRLVASVLCCGGCANLNGTNDVIPSRPADPSLFEELPKAPPRSPQLHLE